jgi:hypothetical protein
MVTRAAAIAPVGDRNDGDAGESDEQEQRVVPVDDGEQDPEHEGDPEPDAAPAPEPVAAVRHPAATTLAAVVT